VSACKSVGNAGPGGVILGAQVGGGTNVSACTGIATPGGAILGAEVRGGTNVLYCTMCGIMATVVVLHS